MVMHKFTICDQTANTRAPPTRPFLSGVLLLFNLFPTPVANVCDISPLDLCMALIFLMPFLLLFSFSNQFFWTFSEPFSVTFKLIQLSVLLACWKPRLFFDRDSQHHQPADLGSYSKILPGCFHGYSQTSPAFGCHLESMRTPLIVDSARFNSLPRNCSASLGLQVRQC